LYPESLCYFYFWGRKINLSGISPAKRSQSRSNSVYVDMSRCDNVQGIFGRDRPILGKMVGTSPESPSFFCVVIQKTFQQLQNGRFSPNLVTKRSLVSHHGIWKVIFETFHFRGHFPPKSGIENQSNRHLTQSRLQVMGCTAERYCLLCVVVQGPGSFRGLAIFYDVWLRHTGRQNCPVFRFWLIFPIQNP